MGGITSGREALLIQARCGGSTRQVQGGPQDQFGPQTLPLVGVLQAHGARWVVVAHHLGIRGPGLLSPRAVHQQGTAAIVGERQAIVRVLGEGRDIFRLERGIDVPDVVIEMLPEPRGGPFCFTQEVGQGARKRDEGSGRRHADIQSTVSKHRKWCVPPFYRKVGGVDPRWAHGAIQVEPVGPFMIPWVFPSPTRAGSFMTPVFALQSLPKSIFLAGPTPRDPLTPSWRPEALAILEELGFEGHVYVPENANWQPHDQHEAAQVPWEWEALNAATVVAFWVPRDLATMPALTTNVEFGCYANSGKCVLGYPRSAAKMRYLDRLAQRFQVPVLDGLRATLEAAVAKTKHPFGDG